MPPSGYRPYRNLPPLAGVTDFATGIKPGIAIEANVARLKRHHWAFRRLHRIFLFRLADEPIYELKMGFSLHAYYCAEHAAAWRQRVGEMREPPLGLETSPDPALDLFFDEIQCAPSTEALLVGIYAHAVPALLSALERHQQETNPLFDHPSIRIVRFALLELQEMTAYGSDCVRQLVGASAREQLRSWEELLARALGQAGGLDGTAPVQSGDLVRLHSAVAPAYPRRPRRDERFPDPYNLGVHAEVALYDEHFPVMPKTLMMYYKRLREIDVPELMASIIVETPGQPWEYVVDMTRQLWDEARHAMMGELGFVRAGIDWPKFVRINFTTSMALNTQLTPLERHGVLYFVEQGLMGRTGKRHEWEVGLASGDEFSASTQDYDWADEVLHARIGRDWYVPQFPHSKEAIEFGDRSWTKSVIDWKKYRDDGLTEHYNWWPNLYHEWCRVQGLPPDPAVLAYHTSYETARPDLKEVETPA